MSDSDYNNNNGDSKNIGQNGIPIAFDEFDGMDVNQFADLFAQSTDNNENNSCPNEAENSVTRNDLMDSNTFPDNSRFSFESGSNSVEIGTLDTGNTWEYESCDSDPDNYDTNDNDDSFIRPVMKPFAANTLSMLRDQIPYSTGDTINFPLRFNKTKATLDFENLEENPFEKLGKGCRSKPLLIVLMGDCLKRWNNPLTPKLFSKLADQDIQPVLFTMEEPLSRHYIYDLLKKVRRIRKEFLPQIDVDCKNELDTVMLYLIMNSLAKIVSSWSLNVLIVDSNPFEVIRHDWITQFASRMSIPVIHIPPLDQNYSRRVDVNWWQVGYLVQQDEAIIQTAYEKICRFLSVNQNNTDGYCFIRGPDGNISTIRLPRRNKQTLLDNEHKKYLEWGNKVEMSDNIEPLICEDENEKEISNDSDSGDPQIRSYLQSKLDRFTKNFNNRQLQLKNMRTFSTSHELSYLLNMNIPKIIPAVYEDPTKLLKFIIGQCSERFLEAVIKSSEGFKIPDSHENDLKFIIVAESFNKVMELLTTALWFWDNCALATWQRRHSNQHLLSISYGSTKHRCQLKDKDDSIFNVWLAEGIRHIIRTAESKCVIVDVPRPGSFSRKELSFLLFNQLDLPPELKIKIIIINQCDMEEENILNSVEGILDKMQSHLLGNIRLSFARARQVYREMQIDESYALTNESRSKIHSKNAEYYMACMKQREMISSRRKHFAQRR